MPLRVRWDDIREGLCNLIADKKMMETFFVEKAYQDGNKDILLNMNIDQYDESKII